VANQSIGKVLRCHIRERKIVAKRVVQKFTVYQRLHESRPNLGFDLLAKETITFLGSAFVAIK
jgi:hypothetical protein